MMDQGNETEPPRNGEGDRAKHGGGVFDTTRGVIEAARKDRRSGNPAEVRLWQALKSRPGGFKFRRQHPIGPYRLDFACLSQRLAIEVDGSIHDSDDQIAHDMNRDRDMSERGFTTIRFAARDVFGNLEGVVTAIVLACGEGPLHQVALGPPSIGRSCSQHDLELPGAVQPFDRAGEDLS